MSKYPKLSFLLLLSVVFLPNLMILYFGGDESARHAIAREALSGNLYTEVTNNKPPLEPIINYFITAGGEALWLDHVFFIFWLWFAAIVLFKILTHHFDRQNAFFGSLLFCALVAMLDYGAGTNERMYVPFLIFATGLAYLPGIKNKKWRSALFFGLAGGALLAAATLIKHTAIFYIFLPMLLALRATPRPFTLTLSAIVGGVLCYLVVWSAIRVPFEIIWEEAYGASVRYMKAEIDPNRFDGLSNIAYALFVQYLPVTLGALLGLFVYLRRFQYSGRVFEHFVIFVWIVTSLWGVGLGFRFRQPYFTTLLPLLVFGTVYALNQLPHLRPMLVKGLSALCFLVLLGYQGHLYWMHYSDRNAYWDSDMKELTQAVIEDTNEGDYVWVSHAGFPIYSVSKRKPAVRHLFFLSMLGQVSMCKSPDPLLSERPGLVELQEGVEDLKQRKPKVVIWTHREKNGCSHRLKLKNFPSFKKIVDENYIFQWKNDLGDYYLRKDLVSKH